MHGCAFARLWDASAARPGGRLERRRVHGWVFLRHRGRASGTLEGWFASGELSCAADALVGAVRQSGFGHPFGQTVARLPARGSYRCGQAILGVVGEAEAGN